MSDTTDLLGNPLSYTEAAILDVHQKLAELAERDDLAPCVASNVRHALAATWQIVTDLDLDYRPV